jgi:signal transduction histidine kinase
MVPYRGRLALRIARLALSLACLARYLLVPGGRLSWVLAGVAAYAAFAAASLVERHFDSTPRALTALVVDSLFFGFWTWTTPTDGFSGLVCGYLLSSAVILHRLTRVALVASFIAMVAVLAAVHGDKTVTWAVSDSLGVVVAVALYKRYVERRLSNTMRHNVIIRSEAQNAREAERERIAADFHDGPLQSFISFQMRLEIIKKLLARDIEAATEELRELQDLCRTQVSELRSFVRSMRPADEGVSLSASLRRMIEQFQRETGIAASFSTSEFHDPSETEISLELLQIIREALHNIQKHSGASHLALSIVKRHERLEVSVEDNGGGFPFSGSFTLDELELLRQGPVSIKRRVRMLGGELTLDSRPGHGASLQIRVPV